MAYVRTACESLRHDFHVSVPLFHNRGGAQKSDSLDPYISELISQRRVWGTKTEKRIAMSGPMFLSMHRFATEATTKHGPDHIDCVLWDSIVVATFGGCRNNEYVQNRSSAPAGTPWPGGQPFWDTLPLTHNIDPEWRGLPTALIREDFVFYDKRNRLHTHTDAVRAGDRITYVHVRWRFDKSKENLIVRVFARFSDHPFCMVTASLSLVARSLRGLSAATEPVCMYRSTNGRRYCLRDTHIRLFMRRACEDAHPDPQHFMRVHIRRLNPHSTRVTAAVILHNAGVPLDDIKFKLRWNSDAVKLYIRENMRTVTWLSAQAFRGVFMDSSH